MHVDEGRSGLVEPAIEVELQEAIALKRRMFGLARLVAEGGKVGIAVFHAGIDRPPQGFVLPVVFRLGHEDHRQGGRIVDLAFLHPDRIFDRIPGKVFLAAPRGRKDRRQGARHLHEGTVQRLILQPPLVARPGVQFVHHDDIRGLAVQGVAVRRDRLVETAARFGVGPGVADNRLIILDLQHPVQAGIALNDQASFAKQLAGLLMRRSRRHHQLPRRAFRPDQVQKGQRRAKRGLPVAARQQQHHAPHDPAAKFVARPIDAANNGFLPWVKLEGPAGQVAFRVAQLPQEAHRTFPSPQRVGDQFRAVDPVWP